VLNSFALRQQVHEQVFRAMYNHMCKDMYRIVQRITIDFLNNSAHDLMMDPIFGA